MLTDLKTKDQFILCPCELRCIVIFDREYVKHNHYSKHDKAVCFKGARKHE